MKKGFDYIGVTVCFYCYDNNNKLLLQKRSENCRDEQGHWDCGGGAMKFGESFEQAVRREVKEEYCVNIEKLTFVGVNNVLREHKVQKTHWIAILYACLVDSTKTKIGDPEKMDEIGWFNINKLPKPLHSMYLIHLEFVKKAGII
ncbi:MAG: NUDIX domain-containing protein [bacterium]|nr:NUDIX domain-containing protein [bacterium]